MNKLKRAIVIFPKFENVYPIEQLRKQFDPLARTIEPHITVVFPFESDLQNLVSFKPAASSPIRWASRYGMADSKSIMYKHGTPNYGW
jgi:hypothetical protein